jgi:ABC-type glycerol-3-phosphate transport system substrate-binding protein
MRNQCYDLSKFTDFYEFKSQFPDVCFTPLTYRGGVYAVPQTIDMNLMFYRTDIFKEFGIGVPKTWEDVIKEVIPKLAENSMNLAASPGYEILLYQNGGELYNSDMTESKVASQISLKAFKDHCDFYTMYGVPKSANFFNRFRTGESPIGFGNIATYIQFVYAAPELTGRWDIAVMPGVLMEDGTINNNIGGLTTSSAMIMADAKNPDEAWEFLKWYMSTENQLQLSERLEAKLDMSARLVSANIEAFSSLDWESEHLSVFLEAMEETKAYNPVLGSYYTARYIGYAFNNVVFSKTMTERQALEYAQENINKELERRRNNQ